MKKILLGILAVLVLAIGGIAAAAAMQPPTYTVVRTTDVAAAPALAYAAVADFHNWQKWSPWDDMDPDMKREYTGPQSGAGASYYWKGNEKVGEGRMTITGVQPDAQVSVKLEFLQPFPSNAAVTYDFTAAGAGSTASWTMVGDHSFFSKVMCLFTSMDSMIGPDFEKGLSRLKTLVEKTAADEKIAAEAKAKAEADAAAAAAAAAATDAADAGTK